jgi:hypothetical protein
MATDPMSRRDGQLGAPDELGAPSPLPPHVQSEMDSISARLLDASAAHDAALSEVVAPLEQSLRAAGGEHNLAIGEMMGSVDSDLRARASPHYSAIERMTDGLYRDMVFAQEDLRVNGTSLPTMTQDVQAILNDETGTLLIDTLMSAPFEQTDAVIAPVVEYQPTPPPGPYDYREPPPLTVTFPYDPAPVPPIIPRDPPPVVPPPPAAPPPPPVKEPCDCPDSPPKCPESPCPPPSTWERSEVCPAARPFYEADRDKAVEEGRAFVDPYNLQYYYTDGCDKSTLPPPPSNLDPEWVRRLRGEEVCAPAPRAFPVPPADPGAPPADKWKAIAWDAPAVCAMANDVTTTARERGRTDRAAAQRGGSTVSAVIRFGSASLRTFIDGALAGFSDEVKDASYKAHAALTGDFFGGFTTLIQSFSFLENVARLDRDAAWDIGLQLAIVNSAQASTSFPIQYLAQSLTYQYQYANPQFIPDQPALDSMYLTGQIDLPRWRCLTKAHGNLDGPHEMALRAKRNRVDAGQVVDLWRRDYIKTEAERNKLIFERGYLDQREIDQLVKLSEWVPTPPDTIRFMVRDVFDPNAVAVSNLDKDFEAKFFGPGGRANPGPAAAYFRAFGLDENTAKLFWRAHWELPSPTQLFEMLHRLRADRPEFIEWQQARGRAENVAVFDAANPMPMVVSFADVVEALELADKAPGWVQRLMAVSYNPMTRTDALNAYHGNAMDERELEHRLRDTGLDEATAERVVQIQKTLKARRQANVTGVWTIRKIANAYREGHINGQRADALLTPLVPDAQQRQDIITGTDAEREARLQGARVKSLMKRFVQGYHAPQEAVAELIGMRLAPQTAQTMVDTWDQERRYPRREITARQVTDALAMRLITPEMGFTRLANLGYSIEDATVIVRMGLTKGGEKVETSVRQARSEIRTIIKDQRAAARQATRDLTERERELEGIIREMERERVRIQGELASRA